MFSINITYAQQSIDFYGTIGNLKNSNFRLNSLESNVSNLNQTQNWEFSISTTSLIGKSSNVNLTGFSLGKKIDKHYLYARFTPGILQDFSFNSRPDFITKDSVQAYKTSLSYKEKYGFGYSFSFNKELSVGFVLRYSQQTFSEEFPIFSTSTDSLKQLIDRGEIFLNKNFWRADIGIDYKPMKQLHFSLATQNIIVLNEYSKDNNNSEFEIESKSFNIKQKKGIQVGINYFPIEEIGLGLKYESSNSFLFGFNYNTTIYNSVLSFGATVFHDKFQNPFIAGVLPSINYTNNLFSVTLSYLKYFSDRKQLRSVDEFRQKGISNIQNNYFGQEKLSLNFNFALSFQNPQQVKFLDVEINEEIFQTFKDKYLDHPFAIGKIVNLTDERISIKPSSFIKDLNSEKIYSPLVMIEPFDTIEVPFFTIISDLKISTEKTKISQANFYLTTMYDEPDDQLQKPLLINGRNSWDGIVANLRYFVKNDIDFTHKYAKGILISYNDSLKEINSALKQVKTIELLFNEFVKSMTYVSDRRATSEYVQFPNETIEIRGGDCDDLSVCFSSILESVGIQTAFIDYKPNESIGHVSLLVNSKLSPENSELITINDRKIFIRKNISGKEEIWIPLETTSLTKFDEAWNVGAADFYLKAIDDLGLSKSDVEIVDVY